MTDTPEPITPLTLDEQEDIWGAWFAADKDAAADRIFRRLWATLQQDRRDHRSEAEDLSARIRQDGTTIKELREENTKPMRRWKITIGGWGTLWCYGTEDEAEQWRAHKAEWEGAIGRKSPCTRDEISERSGEGGWSILGDLL